MAKNPIIPLTLAQKLIASSLPAGAKGRVQMRSFEGYTVIELITDAWKRTPLTEKILRVSRALESGLTETQKSSILRVAVMTPKEEQAFLEAHPRVAKSRQRRSRGSSEISATGPLVLKSSKRRVTL